MVNKRPALIARCTSPNDVVACVNFACDHGVLLSVRGGGHNFAGKAVCEGGLMLDFTLMKGITVDPRHGVARAQAGLNLGEFDRETQSGSRTRPWPLSTVSACGYIYPKGPFPRIAVFYVDR